MGDVTGASCPEFCVRGISAGVWIPPRYWTPYGHLEKGLNPSGFCSGSLSRISLLIPPSFVSLSWCRMTDFYCASVLDICEPSGTQLWNSPCGFPSSVSACSFSWSPASLCWSPYSCLNYFPCHYCNSLLAASVNLCCTDSQGCCLLPLPRKQCPQFLAGPWIALLAVRLALSLAGSAATFFPSHPSLLTPSSLLSHRLKF